LLVQKICTLVLYTEYGLT